MKGFLALKIEGKILQNWYQSRDVDHSKWHGKRRTNDKFKKKNLRGLWKNRWYYKTDFLDFKVYRYRDLTLDSISPQ